MAAYTAFKIVHMLGIVLFLGNISAWGNRVSINSSIASPFGVWRMDRSRIV